MIKLFFLMILVGSSVAGSFSLRYCKKERTSPEFDIRMIVQNAQRCLSDAIYVHDMAEGYTTVPFVAYAARPIYAAQLESVFGENEDIHWTFYMDGFEYEPRLTRLLTHLKLALGDIGITFSQPACHEDSIKYSHRHGTYAATLSITKGYMDRAWVPWDIETYTKIEVRLNNTRLQENLDYTPYTGI